MNPDPFGEGFNGASLLQVNFNHLLAMCRQVESSRAWDATGVDEIQLRNICQRFGGNKRRVAEHMKSFNNGSQLPNVSWPGMSHETFHGFWVELESGGAVNPTEFFIEPENETCDLISSLPKWWNFHSNYIESVHEVLAE